ncbi:Short-chain dehydrogenase/reductase SDR [Sulfitobacter noctilucicola]|uniref:NADP-dependent 3-hydroxy acid dehydrogenase YdfG n=1 Tax=Sulfitobacter noctilucicola TaxID=1342301 RepID=A0A7W6MAD9_9RHOB|nr:SDR family oxidoreductase [Sulfitobacter noctilucicola]KIN64071.1 Short-chain dehydrogenase/reductase SDR [Sulfitobacter noctilucicola]MBB4175425.1 NADP-dependent 3-hydroxy acid dehydrogenase YdfG [Sulfitobacter noctilucicola]
MGTLQGKIAWVTGAGGGIGEASAKALAASGAHVVLSGRREAEISRVASDITADGGKAETAPLDVVDAEATQAIADDLIARLGAIDIFMANAGINIPNRSTAAVTPADFTKVVDINLNGVMNGVLAVLPQMRKAGGGTLILTSSWAGRHPSRLTGPAYSASKHAVVALSHSINQDEGVNGIRCTALMPGEVATPIMQSRPKPPSAEDQARMLQSDDLGSMVRYIAEAPPHVCINEVLISPTWNRSFVGVAEMGGMKL